MMRRLSLLVAVVAVLGCKAPGQTADPFFGRTTIEPPQTGAVAGRAPQPYYSGVAAGAPATLPTPPATATPAAQVPGAVAQTGTAWQSPTATTSANTGGSLWSMLVGDGPRPPIPRRSGYDYSNPDRVPAGTAGARAPVTPQPGYGAMAAGQSVPPQQPAVAGNSVGAIPAQPQPWSAPLSSGSGPAATPVSNPGLRSSPAYPGAAAPSLLSVPPGSPASGQPNPAPAGNNPPMSAYPPSAAVPVTPNPAIASGAPAASAPAVAQRSAPVTGTLQPRAPDPIGPKPVPAGVGAWTPCTPAYGQPYVAQPSAQPCTNPCYNPCANPCQPRSAPVCLYDLPPYVGP